MMTPERIALMRQGVVHREDCDFADRDLCPNDCVWSNLDECLDALEEAA